MRWLFDESSSVGSIHGLRALHHQLHRLTADAREVYDAAVLERRGQEGRMVVDRVRLRVVDEREPLDAVAVDVIDDTLVAILIVLDDLPRQRASSLSRTRSV